MLDDLLFSGQRNNSHTEQWMNCWMVVAYGVQFPILEKIRLPPAISLKVDKTTDVSVSHQLDLHLTWGILF